MVGRVEMFGRVLILRGITAAYMSTDEAETQVDPVISSLQAVLATTRAWSDLSYFIKMGAFIGNHLFPLSVNDT
jgi:hypothetical protein